MDLRLLLPARGETSGFSRSNYEVLFSVFMVALAYFYRRDSLMAYPDILFLFMSLLAANFVFNRIFSERSRVSLWLVDAMLATNLFIISAIISKSGGHLSYFWVLYLLPIFTAALSGRAFEAASTTLLCVLSLGALSAGAVRHDTAQRFAFFVKSSVFVFSVLVIFRTVLARRRLEAEVSFKRFQVEKLIEAASASESRAASESSAAEVGRRTAGLLHDIGNMISIIMLTSEIMVSDESPDPKDAARLHQAAKMARSIIDGSLAMVKGARYEFREELVSVPMENAAAVFARQARGKGVSISVEAEAGLPRVRMSAPHIQRIFINLISNSLSLLSAGGRVFMRAALAGDSVRISVEDDGPGFPQSVLESGMAPFGTTRADKGGTGLGLFNSREIVEKHGGSISIRNRRPSGAVVEFDLPIAGPAEAPPRPSSV
ncbi:MAG TPA: HAMP domain-containing sensor histidine kinase [Elusimicrobiales bacterium]|nr:HAMP domain-containing sensor histidine kinase [Elusimicrobiales bacterium]